MILRGIRFTVLGFLLCAASTAAIAGGMDFPDNTTRGLGRAGAFGAAVNDPSALYFNPAKLSHVRGTQLLIDNHLSFLSSSFTRSSLTYDSDLERLVPLNDFETVSNEAGGFYAPFLAFSTDLGRDDLTIGFGAFGPPGVGEKKFPETGPQRYMITDMNVLMAFYTAGISYRPTKNFSFGMSLQYVHLLKSKYAMIVGMSLSELSGLNVPPKENTSGDVRIELNTTDPFAWSAVFGLWYRPTPRLEVAVSSRPLPINIGSSGTFTFDALGQTISSIMSNTLSLVDNRVELDIVLPPFVRGAIRWVERDASGAELWDIEVDFVYEAWSVLQSFDVRFFDAFEFTPGPDQDPIPMPMAPVGLQKGYRDTYSVRLGSSIHLQSPKMTIRMGSFFETAASPNELSHLDFTASQRLGFTGGLSLSVGMFDFSLAYALILHPDRSVDVDETGVYQVRPLSECLPPYTDPEKCHESNIGNPPGVPAGAGSFSSGMHVFSAGVTVHFN